MRYLAARQMEKDAEDGWRRRLEERRRREAEERRKGIFHSERRSKMRQAMARAVSEEPAMVEAR